MKRSLASFAILLTVISPAFAQTAKKSSPEAAEKAELARLKSKYTTAKKALKAKKGDATRKVAFADAAANYGTLVMNAITYKDRSLKYKTALNLFREALAVVPTHTQAQQNKEMIESIYRSLGKPIPGPNS